MTVRKLYVTTVLLALSSFSVSERLRAEESRRFKLWTGPPIPSDLEQIPFVPGIEHSTIHQATADFKFLHGVALVRHKGVFYANWANSPTNENSDGETLRGRRSFDDAKTWSQVELIAAGFPGAERHSHGILFVHQGKLWTICARFGKGGDAKKFPGLKGEAFVLNEESDRWESLGIVMENCWPYDEPVRMADGNYITGGQDKNGDPVVAVSRGDDLTHWDTIPIPYDLKLKPNYAETSVWAEGKRVMAVIRGGENSAWVALSHDCGKTWESAQQSNLPMPRSQAYLGKLSTGQLYLLSNLKNRDSLVISVSKPGEWTFSRMWRIRHGKSIPPRFASSSKPKQWSYPYGYEYAGKLYVGYSMGKEDSGLSILDIEQLSVD